MQPVCYNRQSTSTSLDYGLGILPLDFVTKNLLSWHQGQINMSCDDLDDEGHSVTYYLARLRDRDTDAVEQIWRRYFEKLLPIARAKRYGNQDVAVDDEDILISVFDRFFRAAGEGRFARLNDRDDLWQILLMLTDRKIRDSHRRHSAARRGLDRRSSSPTGDQFDLAQLKESASHGPSPEFAAEFNEQLSVCLQQLGDRTLHELAMLKLEGYTNPEIAQHLGISLSGVERKLRLIRQRWSQTD